MTLQVNVISHIKTISFFCFNMQMSALSNEICADLHLFHKLKSELWLKSGSKLLFDFVDTLDSNVFTERSLTFLLFHKSENTVNRHKTKFSISN